MPYIHSLMSRVVAALIFLLFPLSWSAYAQSLDDVLGAVSDQVQEFKDLLPDFVCNERVTSSEFDSGKLRKEKTVDSIFTGVQQSNEQNTLRFAFAESREVLAIDGKPVRKGTPFPKLPYRFAGGYSSLLLTTFAPENLQYHNYSIADRHRSGRTEALLVRFATKEGQQKLRAGFQGKQLVEKDVGAAWIDMSSFHVIRLLRQSLNLPPVFSRSIATVDYGPVTIDDREFWMPLKIRSEVNERSSGASVIYVAEYSDCRRFTADIKILP